MHTEQPCAPHSPTFTHSNKFTFLSRSLRPESEQHLVIKSQKCTKSHSRMFSLTVPLWWNDLPTPWTPAEKQFLYAFTFSSLLPVLARTFLERCWKHCINSTSCIYCLFMMINRLFLIFKSLRTKASAKWINIYVNVKCSGHIKSKGHIFTFSF